MKTLFFKAGLFEFVNIVRYTQTGYVADYEEFAIPGGRRISKDKLEDWARNKGIKFTYQWV